MIQIQRDGTKIQVLLKAKYPVSEWTWTFTAETGHASHATMLTENLREALSDLLKDVRTKAYNEGRKRKKRIKNISGSLNPNHVGW